MGDELSLGCAEYGLLAALRRASLRRWAINLAVAERAIRGRPAPSARPAPTFVPQQR